MQHGRGMGGGAPWVQREQHHSTTAEPTGTRGGGGGACYRSPCAPPPPPPSPSPSPFPQRRGSVGSGWSGRRKGTLSTCDRDGTSPWHMHIRTDLRWEQWVYAKVRL